MWKWVGGLVWFVTFFTPDEFAPLSNDLFNRQSNSDHIINSYSHLCCDITVGSNIAGTASSFSFNLFENPASYCAWFVNESTVKWSEQKTEFLLTQSGSSLKIKLIHSFLMLGSKERQCKYCFFVVFFPQLGTAQCLVVFRSIFIFFFCVDLRVHLSRKHMLESVGGAKQAVMTIFFCGGGACPHYYIIEHSKSCRFGRLPSI